MSTLDEKISKARWQKLAGLKEVHDLNKLNVPEPGPDEDVFGARGENDPRHGTDPWDFGGDKERENLAYTLYDLYKAVDGRRPRGIDFGAMSKEDMEAEIQGLERELKAFDQHLTSLPPEYSGGGDPRVEPMPDSDELDDMAAHYGYDYDLDDLPSHEKIKPRKGRQAGRGPKVNFQEDATQDRTDVFFGQKFTNDEISMFKGFYDDHIDWYDLDRKLRDRVLQHFGDEMPLDVQMGNSGTPDEWFHDKLGDFFDPTAPGRERRSLQETFLGEQGRNDQNVQHLIHLLRKTAKNMKAAEAPVKAIKKILDTVPSDWFDTHHSSDVYYKDDFVKSNLKHSDGLSKIADMIEQWASADNERVSQRSRDDHNESDARRNLEEEDESGIKSFYSAEADKIEAALQKDASHLFDKPVGDVVRPLANIIAQSTAHSKPFHQRQADSMPKGPRYKNNKDGSVTELP